MRENKFRNQSAGAKQLEAYSFIQAFYVVVLAHLTGFLHHNAAANKSFP